MPTASATSHQYPERVYAGVLGKIIGVYLGRPFEGWKYDRIMQELGEIHYYVHDKLNLPLIVVDDDISGTFTFLRALPDYGNRRDLTPAQIGQTWLNYIIENQTILWWGGVGNSTEHTAYSRLQHGIAAPHSGSIELNGKVIAEQIGAQIFIDGWGMVAPGDPALAADLARRAGSVSHDGEAVYAAQVLAAMGAAAFFESDIHSLLDTGLSFIPHTSVIYRMIGDIRAWHAQHDDWRATRSLIASHYGYDCYRGNCHVVPNHALIILALLYGNDDFQRSLMIANTSGWDTDCNSGNVGCLLGIKNGLAGINAGPDWRGPVADRLYLPTADGGRAITDAVSEAYRIVNIGRALAHEQALVPKQGARFHFEMPGSVQGFQMASTGALHDRAFLENVEGHSIEGKRSLALHYSHLTPDQTVQAYTPTFIPPEAMTMPSYSSIASPTLYPGQSLSARIEAAADNENTATCRLVLQTYDGNDELESTYGPAVALEPGSSQVLTWCIPDTHSQPIAQVGIEISTRAATSGTLYLDYLTWEGEPDVVFTRPETGGTMWRRAWVNAINQQETRRPEVYRLSQNQGTGLLIQGTREWKNYRVGAPLCIQLAQAAGIAARVQGLKRYYALLLCNDNTVRLVKALDGNTVLAEVAYAVETFRYYELALQVVDTRLQGWVDDQLLLDVEDTNHPLETGAIALVCEEGTIAINTVRVQPARK